MKLGSIDKFVKESREQNQVNGSTGGGDGDKQRSGVWKDGVEGDLSVQEVEITKVRGARGAIGGKNGSHTGRLNRGSRGSTIGSENKVLELVGREQRETVVVVVGQEISTGSVTESSKFILVKEVEVVDSGSKSSRLMRHRAHR